MSSGPRRKIKNTDIIADVSGWRLLHWPGNPARILFDPDLRAFIDERLATMTYRQIVAACREKFGLERAPSKSAISRYWISIVRPQLEPRPKARGVKRAIKRRWPRAARSRAAAPDA